MVPLRDSHHQLPRCNHSVFTLWVYQPASPFCLCRTNFPRILLEWDHKLFDILYVLQHVMQSLAVQGLPCPLQIPSWCWDVSHFLYRISCLNSDKHLQYPTTLYTKWLLWWLFPDFKNGPCITKDMQWAHLCMFPCPVLSWTNFFRHIGLNKHVGLVMWSLWFVGSISISGSLRLEL